MKAYIDEGEKHALYFALQTQSSLGEPRVQIESFHRIEGVQMVIG